MNWASQGSQHDCLQKGTTQGSENLTDMLDSVIKWPSHCAASRVARQLRYTKLNEGKMSHRYSKRKIDTVISSDECITVPICHYSVDIFLRLL